MSHSLGKAFRPRNVAKTYTATAKRHTKSLQMVAKQLTILERWIEEKSSLTLEIDPTCDDLLTQVDRKSRLPLIVGNAVQ